MHDRLCLAGGQDGAGVLGNGAREIAIADQPVKLGELDAVAHAVVSKQAGHAIFRRHRNRDAGQWVQIRHVVAGQRQMHIGALEFQRVLHRSHQRHMRRPIGQMQVERIGLRGVAQGEQRAASHRAGDRLAMIGAFRPHAQLLRLLMPRHDAGRRLRVDGQMQVGL